MAKPEVHVHRLAKAGTTVANGKAIVSYYPWCAVCGAAPMYDQSWLRE